MKKILLIVLATFCLQNIFAQLANVTYNVRADRMFHDEGGVFGNCWENGTEEYSGYGGVSDDVDGTVMWSGCQTCNNNGDCTYGYGVNVGSRTNGAYRLDPTVDGWENDNGGRCNHDGGDDCRTGPGDRGDILFRELVYPGNGYATGIDANGGYGDGDFRVWYDIYWYYTGSANSIPMSCTPQTSTQASGGIRSHSVYLTAGRDYRFQTISGPDTYLRLYGTDGYTIVALNDDGGAGTLSLINYTPATSGWYYIETSNFTRSPLSGNAVLEYEDITANEGDPSIFGANQWNVYGYNHSGYNFADQMNLTNVRYEGFYTDGNLDITSTNRWGSGNAPSDATGWQGCIVTDDNHTVVYKRQGFPCGNYQIDLDGHDDGVRCYVNGVQVYEIDACCADRGVIWEGTLNSTSTVEFRVSEGTGGSNLSVDFDLVPTELSATAIFPTCNGGSDGSIDLSVSGAIHGAKVVKIVQNDGGDALNTAEIQVFNTLGVNIAEDVNGGFAQQSSSPYNPNYLAGLLNNGTTNEGIGAHTSSPNATGNEEWQRVYWNDATTIDNIVIWNRNNTCCNHRLNDLTLEIYGDVEETNLLMSVNINADNGAGQSFTYSPVTENSYPDLTYAWSNSATVEDPSGLSAGSYDVTVTDPYGCVSTLTGITVAEPPAITIAESITNTTCASGNDGAIDITVSNTSLSAEPPAFSDLAIWTKGDAGVVKDRNGDVIQWQDLSGNDNHFNLTYGDNVQEANAAINGNPAIRFDANNIMETDNIIATPYTMIVVGKMNAGANNRLVSSGSINWLLGWHGSTRDDLYCNGWVLNSGTAAGTSPYIYSVAGTGALSTFWRNGTQLASNASGVAAPGSISLGGWGTGNGERSNGDVAEVIVYNRVLTDDERNAVEKYLSDKYAIAGPAGVQPTYSWSNSATTEDISGLSTGNYTVTVTDAAGCTEMETYTVGTDEVAPTANAGADFNACLEENLLAANVAPLGSTGAWSWTPGTVTYENGTTLNDEDAEVSFSVAGVYTGTWTMTNSCSTTASDDLVATVLPPDIITTTPAASGACISNSVDSWIHLFDVNRNIIASVDDNNQDMGLVTVTVPTVGNASASGVCAGGNNAYMGRYFEFSSADNSWYNSGTPVTVRLYFTTAELNSLIAQSHTTATAPASDPNGCEDDDDVNTIADIVATKYNTGVSPGSAGGVFHSQQGNGYDVAFAAHYVDIDVTSFSDIFLHGSEHSVALPVELLNFNAKAVNNEHISLQWATASEQNNDGFELQRSLNGIDFEKVAWIAGNGTTTEIQSYNHTDKEVSANTYYYRLKQIDFDGQFEYSDINFASIFGEDKLTITTFIPNPAENQSSIGITTLEKMEVEIVVYDNLGRIVDAKEIVANAGLQTINFDTEKYSSGIYNAIIKAGNTIETRKLIIAK